MKGGQQDRQDVANSGVNTNTPGVIVTGVGNVGSDMCGQNHVGSQVGNDDPAACQMDMDLSKSEGTQAGGGLHQSVGTCTSSSKGTGTRNKDFGDDMVSLLLHTKHGTKIESRMLGDIKNKNIFGKL